MKKGLSIFASGSGSNAEKIIEKFTDHPLAEVRLIITNNQEAYVIERAKNYNIDWIYCPKQKFGDKSYIIDLLSSYQIDMIVLAGFLLLIPQYLIQAFHNRILNIHPALLPQYGGKGMYGHHVHQTVFDNNEKETGITIHYVNENYDEGQIIFQKKIAIDIMDTPDIIGKKVLALEHKHYPIIVEKCLESF